jgi:predicted transposase YdaD
MAMTFDATLKDMGRESPLGFLATFDQPPALPVKLLNVDLSTVTALADLILGLGDPLAEIVHLDFQSSAAAWKHADVMAYHALLYAHYHVPVHTVIILLRPEAAHSNMNGVIHYAPRPGCGRMDFSYQLVRLWEWPAEELLRADLGVAPLAVLGRLPENQSLEDGLTIVAQRLIERIIKEAPPERVQKLMTDAYLLTGLRLRRDAAARIFRGVRAMQESDTYLAILEEGEEKGQEKATRKAIVIVGQEKCGSPPEEVKSQLENIRDLERLDRMLRCALKAANWGEILQTP